MTRIVDLRDAEDRRLAEAARWQSRLAEADIHSSPEFEAWLREPGNRAAWDQVSAPWDYFDRVAHDPEMIAARAAALGDAKRAGLPVETAKPFRPWAAAIAAALLVGMMGAGVTWWSNRPADYQTAMGERRVVTLTDGSRLSLDSDSEVTVRYGNHARDLRLLRGQARFDVTHDRARPFSVVAGKQKVIATGTAFNIDMAGPKVLVTLIEGRVLVVDENDGSATANALPHVVELRAGQQMTTGTAAAPQIMPVNLQHVTAWTACHIMFDDEPLSSVVERVNRYGGTQIVIADPQVGAMKISGVFNSGDVLGFVEIVTHYLPVRAVSEGTGTIALQSDVKKNGAL